MGTYLLRGRVIPVSSQDVIEDGAVLVEGPVIRYAGAYEHCPETDVEVLSCENGTILPGFIDVHAHLSGEEDAGSFAGGRLFGDQLIGGVRQCALLLESGFTGIRDMSEAGLYLSRGVERGVIRGPRIVPGGKVLSSTGGHGDMAPQLTKALSNQLDHLSRLCDGPDDCTLAVREQFRMGARFIKICATGGVSSPTDNITDVQFSDEELRAIVQEARRHGSYVTAHCTGNEGAYRALLAGVECIEHGVMLTQREIDLMAEKKIPLVSTLNVSLGVARIPGLPDWLHNKAVSAAESNKNSIAMARKAGIPIALGTDYTNSPNSPFSEIGKEFLAMTEAGMTPMEALQAGTIHAAAVMGACMSGGEILMNFTSEIDRPRRTIPLAFVISTVTVAVLCILIAIVALGTYPHDQLEALSDCASNFMSPGMLTFFVIGGACFACLSTVNSVLLSSSHIVSVSAEAKIFPELIAKHNRHGVPIVALWIMGGGSILVCLLGLDVFTLMTAFAPISTLITLGRLIPPFIISRRYPHTFKTNFFKMNRTAMDLVTAFAIVLTLIANVSLISELTLTNNLIMLALVAAFYGYCGVRVLYLKKKGVDLIGEMRAPYAEWEETEKKLAAEDAAR